MMHQTDQDFPRIIRQLQMQLSFTLLLT
uniref:Uncharacterized protein n=1 Tax=Anguilla anguilla TaxID=7936 RepID=A0A0E9U7P7_ANGAN